MGGIFNDYHMVVMENEESQDFTLLVEGQW